MVRDLNYTADGSFAGDLPNGLYQVVLTLGDPRKCAHDRVVVDLEGRRVDVVRTTARSVAAKTPVPSATSFTSQCPSSPDATQELRRHPTLHSPVKAVDGGCGEAFRAPCRKVGSGLRGECLSRVEGGGRGRKQAGRCVPKRLAERSHVEWTGPGLNRRHLDFQSSALPTELPVPRSWPASTCDRRLGQPRPPKRIARWDAEGPRRLDSITHRSTSVNRWIVSPCRGPKAQRGPLDAPLVTHRAEREAHEGCRSGRGLSGASLLPSSPRKAP